MTQYAAYDEQGIWAVGGTADEALANFYREANVDPDTTDDEGNRLAPEFRTAPMTDRLAAKIEAEGFDCKRDSYTWTNGMLDYNPND